jgi:hypothetical protein
LRDAPLPKVLIAAGSLLLGVFAMSFIGKVRYISCTCSLFLTCRSGPEGSRGDHFRGDGIACTLLEF